MCCIRKDLKLTTILNVCLFIITVTVINNIIVKFNLTACFSYYLKCVCFFKCQGPVV